ASEQRRHYAAQPDRRSGRRGIRRPCGSQPQGRVQRPARSRSEAARRRPDNQLLLERGRAGPADRRRLRRDQGRRGGADAHL
ncbi:MAG: hypothetical protein AVDCRST_MAG27-3537, partial [uncultured Craurococcus sp.]